MEWIDTHAHLYLHQFDHDRPAMLERAMAAGGSAFFLPNIDLESIPAMLALEAAYPDTCFAMMGLHPCSVKEDYQQVLQVMHEWFQKRAFAAIGETGIDLYWDKSTLSLQISALEVQLEWAKNLGLPIVLHTREAVDITTDIVHNAWTPDLRGVFHCFSGTVAQAERIIDMGFYLGIGGVLTYKNGGLEPVIEAFGLRGVVLETDAPYLAPNPYRGKRNESVYVPIVIERLVELTGHSPEEVAHLTTRNARQLFAESFANIETQM